MPYVAAWQVSVEDQLIKYGKVNSLQGLPDPKPRSARNWTISPDGKIAVETEETSAFVVFIPTVEGASVRWNCYGSPKNEFIKDSSEARLSDCGEKWRIEYKRTQAERPKASQ